MLLAFAAGCALGAFFFAGAGAARGLVHGVELLVTADLADRAVGARVCALARRTTA
ncbi:MAG: hypothetical protein ABIP94_05780 [Planctomycetota bacterium]